MVRIFVACLCVQIVDSVGDPTCWQDGVQPEQCCHPRFGPQGNSQCFDGVYTFERCCGKPDAPVAIPTSHWNSDCIESDVMYRHLGEHGLFVDVTTHGHRGCFLSDCHKSDKVDVEDRTVCALLCAEVEECTHWSFGPQDGVLKCFLRKSDGGREAASGWSSGAKSCTPEAISNGFAALAIADLEALKACDSGKSETCPDLMAAVNTWKLAFKYLKKGIHNRVDAETLRMTNQISADSANIAQSITGAYRPSVNPPDYPRTAYNNRLVIDSLRDFLNMFPKAELSENDYSLPVPLRFGKLCGRTSCYEM